MTLREKAQSIAECFERIQNFAIGPDRAPNEDASNDEIEEWIENAATKAEWIEDELDTMDEYRWWP